MKRIALISIIAGIMVLATACGGSAPAATQAPAQPAATEVPAQPAATEAPAQPIQTDVAPATGAQVDITLTDNKIEASLTSFQVGVPYTFVITNAGRHAHNFNINTPVSKAGSLENALSTALLAVGQSQLGGGASVTVEYTFPDTAAGTSLEFSCLIRRHYEDGMLLPITVSK
jgi:uncharacterized cupredoxin-like copper-binding protein